MIVPMLATCSLVLALIGNPTPTTHQATRETPDIPAVSWSERTGRFGGWEAVTRPSRDSTMRFTIPIEIREILVAGGETVSAGELLIRGRDGEILAALAAQRIRADNEGDLQAAASALELSRLRFEKGEQAMRANSLNPNEFDELRLALESAKGQHLSAQARLAQERAQVVTLERQAERYRLEAPFEGQVESVLVELGQGVSDNEPVIRIVQTDPLWIDVYPPTPDTLRLGLREGSTAEAMLDLPGEEALARGKVLYVSPVADAASGTRRVRVEIPNPARWPAGTKVQVRFAPAGEAAQSGAPEPVAGASR